MPLFSGYAFRTLNILNHQRDLGWATCHLTGPKQGRSEDWLETVKGFRFYRTAAHGWIARRFPCGDQINTIWATARRLVDVVEKEKPDILHAHSPCLNGIAALYVGKRLGIPVVYEMRATWEDAAVNLSGATEDGVRYRLSRALESFVLRRADAVVTICEGLSREIVNRGIPAPRVTVVPNAVDVTKFTAPLERDKELARELGIDDRPTAGFIGSFYDYEGLELLIRSIPQVCAKVPNAMIVLVGDGPVRHSLERQAAEIGVDKNIVFCGRVPHEDIERYYSLVNVFVYPRKPIRLTELTTPLKPLEAMAQAKTVLASDVGGHRELITPGETGCLFPAGDSDRLAEALTELLTNRQRRAALKTQARKFAEQERTWAQSVRRYEAVYQRLLRVPDLPA